MEAYLAPPPLSRPHAREMHFFVNGRFVRDRILHRLVRDAYRAVLTAYELGLPDCETHYASFRQLVEELGYERVDVGFRKPEP
jgi:hypothetical protein